MIRSLRYPNLQLQSTQPPRQNSSVRRSLRIISLMLMQPLVSLWMSIQQFYPVLWNGLVEIVLDLRLCTLYFVAMQWTYLRSSPILISRYPLVGGSSVVLPTEWRGKSLQCGRRRRMIFITRILHTMHSEEREAIHSPTACFVLHTFHINIIPMLLFQHQII